MQRLNIGSNSWLSGIVSFATADLDGNTVVAFLFCDNDCPHHVIEKARRKLLRKLNKAHIANAYVGAPFRDHDGYKKIGVVVGCENLLAAIEEIITQ